MNSTKKASPTTRKRGRGDTPQARKYSRASFKAWDTRRRAARVARRRLARLARDTSR